MPVISRQQVDPDVRKKFDIEHKAQLRRTLSNVSLTEDQRTHVLTQLSSVGRPKVYQADSPPKSGAISFEKAVPAKKVSSKRRKS